MLSFPCTAEAVGGHFNPWQVIGLMMLALPTGCTISSLCDALPLLPIFFYHLPFPFLTVLTLGEQD